MPAIPADHPAAATAVKGAPVPAQRWEEQFRAGSWDYLESDAEAAHYQALCAFYQSYLPHGSLLDVGCGIGTLYRYLAASAGMPASRYSGIDIAQEAVRQAAARFAGASFKQCDYSLEAVEGRFDGVVFNETLYYFSDPVAILKKSIASNLKAGGCVMVSMYGEHHEDLWQAAMKLIPVLDEKLVQNEQQVRWTVRIFRLSP